MIEQQSFSLLQKKVEQLLDAHSLLKEENAQLKEELLQYVDERKSLQTQIDQILGKLEKV